MGLFGTKKEKAPTTTQRDGWKAECGPLCGFKVQDHDKAETAQILMLHMKRSHKTNLTEAEALSGLQPTKL